MSDTDNTQDTNAVTTEQLFSTINSLLSNLQGYVAAMNSEAIFGMISLKHLERSRKSLSSSRAPFFQFLAMVFTF